MTTTKNNPTPLAEVKERMADLLNARAVQLEEIQKKEAAALQSYQKADAEAKAAMEQLDLAAYDDACTARRKAETAAEMYRGRYDQLTKMDYVSEAESDAVVHQLLDYENELADAFRARLAKTVEDLTALLEEYSDDVRKAETVLNTWTRDVHRYYLRRSATRTLPDGSTTNRWDTPQYPHGVPGEYTGCQEATRLRQLLADAKPKLANAR